MKHARTRFHDGYRDARSERPQDPVDLFAAPTFDAAYTLGFEAGREWADDDSSDRAWDVCRQIAETL